ncbi:uncharacterized protein BXZ73DRAFT_80837 [Epithele typhae]|uniref:uncharacterized protein n=1 Tax=Epithele typhae TaxID=378194 RepID=UPI0020085BD3|nr:uncharacterized protein BXZ73DRAFT_80837 [Epithele typhae]KAH9917388.1 hypothetical protein BXZ73DRAFT_80837 [Epithele typhae]
MYTRNNPNGRTLTLIDHNSDLKIWELGAPSDRPLPRKSGKEGKLSLAQDDERVLYHLHSETLPSTITHCANGVIWVSGVFESVLPKQEWPRGDQCVVVDILFTWARFAWYAPGRRGAVRADKFPGALGVKVAFELFGTSQS